MATKPPTTNNPRPRRVVLASASPRRLDLLLSAGWQVDVRAPHCAESCDSSRGPEALVLENALRKWSAVEDPPAGRCILAADTVVWHGGEVLGKPVDQAEARRFLGRLSGTSHEVFTGLALGFPGSPPRLCCERTVVHFHSLEARTITGYLASIDPLDKAGGYAAQSDGGRLIASIEGELSNVIGLPLERLEAEWQTLGF